jgi:hypothetical protein
MELIRHLLLTLGINAVPITGFAVVGWSAATALVIYWFENLFGSLLIAARIALHQRLTRKRGHYRAHFDSETTAGGKTRRTRTPSTFTVAFLLQSLIFTLAHGVFLGVIVLALGFEIEPRALATGVAIVVLFQVMDFGIDLIGLRDKPFVWIKRQSQLAMGRVVVVHLALIFGMFAAAVLSDNTLFFLPFAGLKLLTDIGNQVSLAQQADGPPPMWLTPLMNRIRPRDEQGRDFTAYWEAERLKERTDSEIDEQVAEPPNTGRRKGAG